MKWVHNKKLMGMTIGGVVVIAAVLGFINKGSLMGKTQEAEVSAKVSVETKTMKPENIEAYINLSSKIQAESEVVVYPKVSGNVTKVNVHLGDVVKAGDVLFEIDDSAYRLQASQASAQLSAAQANYDVNVGANLENQVQQLQTSVDSYQIQYDDLKEDLDNAESLYAMGATSKKELDTLKSSTEKVRLQLVAAKDSLTRANEKTINATKAASAASVQQAAAASGSASLQLGYTKVTAPIGGVISAFNISEGMLVSAQTQSLTIVNNDKLKLSFNVSDDYINKIAEGSKVYVTVSAASDKIYEGIVAHLSPAANSATLLYPVEVSLNQVDTAVKPGMFASVKLVVDKREQTLCLPLNSIINKGGETYVFTLNTQNTVEKKIVKTGIFNDEMIQITEGIKSGDKVVVKGQSFVKEGDAVDATEAQ